MGNPLLASLVDPFTAATINTAVWNSSTGGGADGIDAPGRAFVQVSGSAFNHLGAGTYDATGQSMYAKVTPAAAGTGGKQVLTLFQVSLDGNNQVQFACTPGTSFQAQVVTAGTTTTVNLPAYDPTAHAWWRLRETGGTWAFDASPDGAAWTTLTTMAYTWSPAAVGFFYLTHTSDGTTGGSAYLEHVNTPIGASGLMPSWPRVTFGIAFNQNASNAGSPAFVDLSSRLRGSWSAQLSGRQYELDQVQSGQLTCTLWNLDGALDPLNASSPYYPNVVPMKPARLQAIWPPSRNLLPRAMADGTNTASGVMTNTTGSVTSASGLSPAPPGHTAAFAWTLASGTGTGSALGLGNGPAGFPAADSTAIPVVAGQSYTFSCWVSQASGGDTTLQFASRISWYDMTGARITASVGTGVVLPVLGTWAQVVTTLTAPAGAVLVRPAVQLATSPSVTTTAYVTAWQAERGAAATAWTPGGVITSLWSGFVERFPQQWDNSGTYGLVDLTCVDALATLADFTMSPNTPAQLLALSPTRLYPLDEPTGSTRFRDMTGRHGSATATASPYGAGTVTAGSSVTGTGFVGAPGPVVTLANPAPSSTPGAGSYISLGTPNGPPTSGGWTRLICFRTTTVPSGTNMTIWNACGPAFGGASASLYIDSSQHVNCQVTSLAGNSMSVSAPGIAACDGNWHMAAMILTPDGKRLDINVDGSGFFATSAFDCHTTGVTSDTIGANVIPTSRYNGNYFSGDIAYACEVPTNNVPSFPDIAAGFSTGWAGETSAARAQRILNLSGYMGPMGTQDMTTAMGGATLSGQDAMSALQLVGDSESGQVYVDGAGTVQLSGRLWRYYQNAPAVLVGEEQAGGEIPYLDDISVEFDTTHIYNQVSVTNQGAPGSAQQPAVLSPNPTSATAYAPRTLQRTINVLDPTVPQYAANYLSQQYGQPLARIAQLTVDPASNPALWSMLLGLGFGSRVQVSRRPPSGPGAQPLVLQQFLEHLTWDGDNKGSFRVSMQLSSATPFLGWWVISSLHTTVHTAVSVGDTVITLDPLTGSALNPAVAVLPPGTVLTLSYGDPVHQENVTVQSVGATSPGYTSVAVTLTAATAHSHPVGAVVCQPLPGGYTLPALPLAGFPASLDAAATLSATGPRVTY